MPSIEAGDQRINALAAADQTQKLGLRAKCGLGDPPLEGLDREADSLAEGKEAGVAGADPLWRDRRHGSAPFGICR
jgi:hypothetical protein